MTNLLKKRYRKIKKGYELKLENSKKNSPRYWSFSREAVARAVALGLFVAFLPIMPFQTILVLAIAAFLGANVPVAFATSFISNPITIAPFVIFTTSVGKWVLNENQTITDNYFHALAVKLGLIHEPPAIIQYGKEYFIGLPIVCISAALIGYFLVTVGYSLWSYVHQNRK